jgi:cell cycle arrest protein BUB3
VASAGWDSTLRLWDPRAATAHVATLQLPGKAYSMSSAANRLVVATSGRQVDVYDVGQLTGAGGATIPEPEQRRESSLKHQTRCVRCFPDGTGYALSSIEGRVAMEYFDLKEEVQAKKYAFKCHRRVEEGRDMIYPVNSIAFNARYGTFATGGGDGTVNVWDGKQKKRLFQVTGYGTSIAALAFNADASLLAIAASYTWEKGETAAPPDAIYVRQMSDAEVVPRHLQQQQQQQATHVGNSGHVGAHAVAV